GVHVRLLRAETLRELLPREVLSLPVRRRRDSLHVHSLRVRPRPEANADRDFFFRIGGADLVRSRGGSLFTVGNCAIPQWNCHGLISSRSNARTGGRLRRSRGQTAPCDESPPILIASD